MKIVLFDHYAGSTEMGMLSAILSKSICAYMEIRTICFIINMVMIHIG